jgi:hypothetical protein
MVGTTAAIGSSSTERFVPSIQGELENTMSALILISAALSTLVLSIVLSGMLVLAIKDMVHAFSDKMTLPLGGVYNGNVRKIQTLAPAA